jgi:hypothetical protein
VEWIGERASAQTWTCQVRFRDRRLPDLALLDARIRSFRVGASLRGLEAEVEGHLRTESGEVLLEPGRSGETLRLAPLTRKVEWDAPAGRDEPPSEEERRAHARLRAELRPGRLRVVGPLRDAAGGGIRTLEVREYRWLEG